MHIGQIYGYDKLTETIDCSESGKIYFGGYITRYDREGNETYRTFNKRLCVVTVGGKEGKADGRQEQKD